MNRVLEFKEKIISYLEEHGPESDLFKWLDSQPELDQPDIFRALKIIFAENFELKKGLNWDEVSAKIDDKIETFEQEILDRKLHKAMFMMEMEQRITDEETFGYYIEFIRQEVITKVVVDPENQENWDFVDKIIQIEKDSGFYDPENWKTIF